MIARRVGPAHSSRGVFDHAIRRHHRERQATRATGRPGISPKPAQPSWLDHPGRQDTPARWIASALGKPLWVLDLTAAEMSSARKTGNNLRAALDHAKHAAIL